MKKYLGIDFGSKKVGIAIGDDTNNVAFPRAVFVNDDNLIDNIVNFIKKENISIVIIGESKGLSGVHNNIHKSALLFLEELSSRIDINIFFEDERYTTAQARNFPISNKSRGNVSRIKREKTNTKNVDAYAAAIILQSFLDKNNKLS